MNTPIDVFFAKVQTDGFSGLSPSPNDVMCDRWASAVRELWDRTTEGLPRAEHPVYLIWQWLYCEMAGCKSRVVAGPEAMRAAGVKVTEQHMQQACDLLWRSESF